ncbi:hypothetical protein BX616_004560 [Lobosporangium transversale]|nr:hypothetical protein BX616_004560 [Lobosporangium transversale]
MATTDLKVIVAGLGIAGLAAAIALELTGFDYTVLEQDLAPSSSSEEDHSNPQTTAVHVGGAVQIGPTALHFLHQLGIYEEIQKISKPLSGFSMNEHNMNYLGRIDMTTYRERYGYHTEVMSRSQLHALLLQRIPPKRIVAGKVLGMIQSSEKVTVRCSDGATYEGDILIAADGAFSNVRHTLYWNLDEKKLLPKADAAPMSVDLHIISGCTKPLDPTKYPMLLDAMSEIQSIQLPNKPYTIWFVPLLDNRISWDITCEVNKTAIRQGEAFKVNQWRPEDIEETLNAVKEVECPFGGRIGDLIDTTDSENMYFNMAEERFCETWYGGRTVLVACHKGFYQPVSEAIVDVVTLINFLSAIESDSMESLTAAFQAYKERRSVTAKAAVEQCSLLRQVFTGKGRAASLKRNIVFNYMPEKYRYLLDDKRNEDRPQLWCLPFVKDHGIVKALPNSRPGSTPSNEAGSASTDACTSPISPIAMSPTTSSPRSSRTSWSSFSRPTFSMPSAPNIPLFSLSSSIVVKRSTSDQSATNNSPASLNQPMRGPDSPSKESGPFTDDAAMDSPALAKKAAMPVAATEKDNDQGVFTATPKATMVSTADIHDNSYNSSDEEEFVNCSPTLNDEIGVNVGKRNIHQHVLDVARSSSICK